LRCSASISGLCRPVCLVRPAEHGGADLNIPNNEGRTAMHLAAEKGCLMVVEFLTKVGADYNIKDNVSGASCG
jgi:ankyrin repeat protein